MEDEIGLDKYMGTKKILTIKHLTKYFPGVRAVDDVSIDFYEGEVHALIGENGAGKSTLMNLLFGVFTQDKGKIIIKDQEVVFRSPNDAMNHGIAMIHQENSLIPYMSVMDNIFLGRMPEKRGFVNNKNLLEQTNELMKFLPTLGIDPNTKPIQYSVAQKQMIEILKALSLNPKVLLMDEPTASLTEAETNDLMKIIRMLKIRGTSIIYVSHRLEEIFEISDRITVLRDGQLVSTKDKCDTSKDRVISEMVGRDLSDKMCDLREYETARDLSRVVLEVNKLTSKKHFSDISFRLYKGEILGFAGLVGAGKSELMESIFGYDSYNSGEIIYKGNKMSIKHPQDAIDKGIGLVPEDRKKKGLFLSLNVKENINIATYDKLRGKIGLLSKKRENKAAIQSVQDLNIKTPSIYKKINELSGGNQQKAIFARWLNKRPDVLILDEPTHGIDVGAKAEIYSLIQNLAKRGISVMIISSEMSELMLLSDRIAVMWNGHLEGILERHEFSQEKIMNLATGMKK